MAELPQLTDAYLAGPPALRQAVAGMSREQLTARPVPGKWSTLEVVCHLADFDPKHRAFLIFERNKTALLYGAIGLFHFVFRKKFLAISMSHHGADVTGINVVMPCTTLDRFLPGQPDDERAGNVEYVNRMADYLATVPPESLSVVENPEAIDPALAGETGAANKPHLTEESKAQSNPELQAHTEKLGTET